MSKTPCPCIDCISFAICNAQVNEFINSFKKPPVTNKLYLAYRDVLIKRCGLLYSWMTTVYSNDYSRYDKRQYEFIIDQMSKVYKCEFKGYHYDDE